jgi:predicted DNA-binding transcriptional regulator AlpA
MSVEEILESIDRRIAKIKKLLVMAPKTGMDTMIGVREVCKFLGISRETWRNWRATPSKAWSRIPALPGRRERFLQSDVMAAVEAEQAKQAKLQRV